MKMLMLSERWLKRVYLCSSATHSLKSLGFMVKERVDYRLSVKILMNATEYLQGQLKAGVRRLYSSPPSNGSKIVAAVFTNSEEKTKWLAEVEEMRLRILEMRTVLVDELKKALPEKNFEHLLKQRGMFSYTGFTSRAGHTFKR